MSSAPPPPPPNTGASRPGAGTGSAELGIRFGARLIDSIIVLVPTAFIVGTLIIGLLFTDAANTGGMSPLTSGGFNAPSIVGGLLSLAITLAYFVGFEANLGWTPGKKLLGLTVTGAGGGNPTVEESLKRNAFYALAVIPLIGGLARLAAMIWIAVSINGATDNRGVHDEFAGTSVIRS